MKFEKATRSYERWVRRYADLVCRDIARKHRAFGDDPYQFFRVTHYRWAQHWFATEDETLHRAPRVLAVADLHIENFGTWRDAEGRLIWGVNDFDEAFPLPYTQDLVRLAAGVSILRKATDFELRLCDTAKALLAGYRSCLEDGPRPFVIERDRHWLRDLALEKLPDPRKFWEKLSEEGEPCEAPPGAMRRLLARELPDEASPPMVVRRSAGMGSPGMPRFVGLAEWAGSPVAREVKRLPPAAYFWASQSKERKPPCYSRRLAALHPHPDPYYRPVGRWVVKRLAPDCAKLKLAQVSDDPARLQLLEAMGFETANLHLASGSAPKILADLDQRSDDWLKVAAKDMAKRILRDYREWSATHEDSQAAA